jgi:RNA polymerase sigma-70 factor (ECF subfamily)
LSALTDDAIARWGVSSLDSHVLGLRRYFAKRVPASEIDDLVQEVFLRMQPRAERSPIDYLDRYLFAVAASVLTDRARRRLVRHQSSHESFEEVHHPTEERSPERVLLDREALKRTVDAIAELPVRTRDIFVLHRFEERTCDAIARDLGISVSAVEKHVMRALRLLRDRIDAD